MAPPFREGSQSHPQRFPTDPQDRAARGQIAHPNNLQAANKSQDTMAYQTQPIAGDNSLLPTGLQSAPGNSSFYYPNGIPNNYKMVTPENGEAPREYFEDNLPMSFYMAPPKEVKARFSTDNGRVPSRGVSPTHFHASRELRLWSAEEIQTRSNAVRKKHWEMMRAMTKPEYWEDLYDYFDPYDIYFQGAQNLWNLVHHLYHENQQLLGSLNQKLACEIGQWCDRWVATDRNKTKLEQFVGGNVLNLLDKEELEDIQGMPPFNIEILRTALFHRQGQLLGMDWARPTIYPGNNLENHWQNNTLQLWLAGQPVADTPSGLVPAQTPPHSVLTHVDGSSPQSSSADGSGVGRTSESPTKIASTTKMPLIVSGTNKPNVVAPRQHAAPAPLSTVTNQVRDTFDGNRESGNNTVSTVSNRPHDEPFGHTPVFSSPAVPPFGPAADDAGPPAPKYYHQSVMPYGHPFSMPLTTGPNGAPQPYFGPTDHPPVPGQQHPHAPYSQLYATTRFASNDQFPTSGKATPAPGTMPPMNGTRVQSAAHSTAPEAAPSQRYNKARRNATANPAFEPEAGQSFDQVPTVAPLRWDSGQQGRNEIFIGPNSSGSGNFGHYRSRGEPKGWEKVQNADESIHGPVFRRSPTKENRPRALSRASHKMDNNCVAVHPTNADKWAYIPCDCPTCQQRNRSVFVSLRPPPKLSMEELQQKMRNALFQWGMVEKVIVCQYQASGHLPCIVRFTEGSRVADLASSPEFDSPEFQCKIWAGATHHSDYGNAMRHENDLHGPRGSNTWRASSNSFANKQSDTHFGQAQCLPYRRDPRAQVSLEQYMRPQPAASTAAQPIQHAAATSQVFASSAGFEKQAPQEKAGFASDSMRPVSNAWSQPILAVEKTTQPSAKAEAQSKPPSEEVLPDSDLPEEAGSPQSVKSSGSLSKGKTIRVNLPATPQKDAGSGSQESEEPTTPSKKVSTPRNSKLSATPTKEKTPPKSKGPDGTDNSTKTTVSTEQEHSKAPVVSSPNETAPRTIAEDKHTSLEKPLESPKYGKGKYRKAFTQGDGEQVDLYDGRISQTAAGSSSNQPAESESNTSNSQPLKFTILTSSKRLERIEKLDKLIDARLAAQKQAQDEQAQNTIQATHLTDSSVKKKSKSKNKKRKKLATVTEGAEPGSSQQPTNDGALEKQGSVPSMISGDQLSASGSKIGDEDQPATVTELLARVFLGSTKLSTEQREPAEPSSKGYRANAGGSLRMPKNRKKQPAELNLSGNAGDNNDAGPRSSRPFDHGIPSAASFVTAKERSSSDGSQGMLSTPATPPSERVMTPATTTPEKPATSTGATPQSKTSLNPQATEFISPAVRHSPVSHVKLAPIPLKRPEQHQRTGSQASCTTSRTVTPGNSPVKSDASSATTMDAKKQASQNIKENKVSEVAQSAAAKDASEAPQKQAGQPFSRENEDENGSWQVQRNKRTFSKHKPNQSKGKNQGRHQQPHGKQGTNNNRQSPKKPKTQGQSPQPRHVSNHANNQQPLDPGNKNAFPSLPAAPAPGSGLPPTSIWGAKARSKSSAAGPAGSSAAGSSSAAPTKGEKNDGNPRPEDGGSQQ